VGLGSGVDAFADALGADFMAVFAPADPVVTVEEPIAACEAGADPAAVVAAAADEKPSVGSPADNDESTSPLAVVDPPPDPDPPAAGRACADAFEDPPADLAGSTAESGFTPFAETATRSITVLPLEGADPVAEFADLDFVVTGSADDNDDRTNTTHKKRTSVKRPWSVLITIIKSAPTKRKRNTLS